MKMNYKKGFTLIELLVVIAIIGILSSVVLASLNSARDKGADAAVKANLNGVRAQAELVYDTAGNYTTVGADANVQRAYAAADSANGGNSVASTTASSTYWMMAAQLKSSTQWYCVDSNGKATTTSTTITSGNQCP
jgi:prepilin-type N-terminal cleavage/methylation domain-containing protein